MRNNRIIQFRALCNVDCKEGDNITKMVYFSQLELDNGLWFNPDDENIHHINEWLTKPMQFTGLTDKNGVDIYEGDILEFPFEMGIAFVISDGFRFAVESPGSGAVDYEDANTIKTTTIIGNIHQHKHLLK